jgi:type I restriction enzyme M protein
MVEAALEKEGRVSVVVPHGVLFRGGAEGRIRQKMIEENLLDAVVGLPGNLFPTTSIPVAILVFDRSREKGGANQPAKMCFLSMPAATICPVKTRTPFPTSISARSSKPSLPGRMWINTPISPPFEEIKENDFNLNIPRYVDTFEEEEEIDIDAVQREIDAAGKELVDVRAKMAAKLKIRGD